jgi:hypothetical protein
MLPLRALRSNFHDAFVTLGTTPNGKGIEEGKGIGEASLLRDKVSQQR